MIVSISSGKQELGRFDLRRGPITIGRDPENTLVIRADEVAAHHARIRLAGDTALLEDLKSGQGTQLNDRPLDRPTALNSGDLIGIGPASLQVQLFMLEAHPEARQAQPSNSIAERVPPTEAVASPLVVPGASATKLAVDTGPTSLGPREMVPLPVKRPGSVSFEEVVPVRELFRAQSFRSPMVWILFLGLLPLTYGILVSSHPPVDTFYFFGIYFSFVWGIVLYRLIEPTIYSSLSETVRWAIICALFTTATALVIVLGLAAQPGIRDFYALEKSTDFWQRLIGYVLGTGLVEELDKAIPVFAMVYLLRKVTEPRMAAFYGAMSGLGFAIAEGVLYSTQVYTSILNQGGTAAVGEYVTTQLLRQISLPINHAIWAAILGFFIGLAYLYPLRRWQLFFTGLAIVAVSHGLYDTFAGFSPGTVPLALIILLINVLLFVNYLQKGDRLMERAREAETQLRGG
jgi:RsiW-degrading membrane proteinase PrsW (M82 family)